MKAVAKRSILSGKKPPERVNIINAVCTTGATCAQITGSPVASAALGQLKLAAGKLGTSLASRAALLLAYRTACQTVQHDEDALDHATGTYFNAVDDVALGDPAIVAAAGGTPRGGHVPPALLSLPDKFRSSLGKESMESIIQWAVAAGASAYKLRVNFTPNDPAGWVELSPGRSRRRVITAPKPAAQFLVCVASIGGDVSSDWSAPILATAR